MAEAKPGAILASGPPEGKWHDQLTNLISENSYKAS